MKQQGPSQEEVNTARDSFVNRQAFDYESSAAVIDRLVEYDITGQPLDTLQRRFKAYQAATLEDVRRVAGRYLLPEGLTILVVGNQDLFDRPLSDFGSGQRNRDQRGGAVGMRKARVAVFAVLVAAICFGDLRRGSGQGRWDRPRFTSRRPSRGRWRR